MKKTKTMTKAAMVAEIQKTDATMWLELKRAERQYGTHDELVGGFGQIGEGVVV
jgi:hypothetical protein